MSIKKEAFQAVILAPSFLAVFFAETALAIDVDCERLQMAGCNEECMSYEAAWDKMVACRINGSRQCVKVDEALEKSSQSLQHCLRR